MSAGAVVDHQSPGRAQEPGKSHLRPIEQFREHGLSRPIRIGPGLRSYLFLLLGGPFLVGGSVLALMQGGPVVFLAGLIGLPFFGFAFLIYLIVLVRSQRRGLLEFSNRGIYHALYRLDLAWSDIGPAWIFSVHAGGRVHADVLLMLRNVSKFRPALGTLERFLFAIMERQGRSASGGALDSGMKAFGLVFGEAQGSQDAVGALADMRRRLSNEPDAIVLPIPRIIRFGLSNEDTIEIINTVVARLARGDHAQ